MSSKSKRIKVRFDTPCKEAGEKVKEFRNSSKYNNVHLNRHENGVTVSASLRNNNKPCCNTNITNTYDGRDDYHTFGYSDDFWQ